MINYIWGLFLVVGVLYSIIKKDPNLTNNLISSGKNGLDIILWSITNNVFMVRYNEISRKIRSIR